jgi:hypothetical protein
MKPDPEIAHLIVQLTPMEELPDIGASLATEFMVDQWRSRRPERVPN